MGKKSVAFLTLVTSLLYGMDDKSKIPSLVTLDKISLGLILLAMGDINENGIDLSIKNRHNKMVKSTINDFFNSSY
ncbi:MAG: hypothetical protein M3M88_04905 [Thermoproteota archaeon]|nr:hypothetical protein [Thermoproteota archaeon]